MKPPTLSSIAKPIPGDLYSISEAATLARISAETIRRWIQKKRIDAWGRPGMYRVSLSQILPQAVVADPAHYKAASKPGPRPKSATAGLRNVHNASQKPR